MKYQDIRNAFQKCGIAITDDGISLLFQKYDPPRWVGIDVNDEEFHNKKLFQSLADTCTGIRVSMIPDSIVRFMFDIAIPTEEIRIYPPVQETLTVDEYTKRILDTLPSDTEQYKDFCKFLSNIQMKNDLDAIYDIADYAEKHIRREPIRIKRRENWSRLRSSAVAFADNTPVWTPELEEPDDDIDFGTAEFYLESVTPRAFYISGERLENFRDLTTVSHGFSFEAKISENKSALILSFFS